MDDINSSHQEIEIPQDEGISAIHFSPFDFNILVTSTWSKTLRYYDINTKKEVDSQIFDSPLQCFNFLSQDLIAAGGIDGKIYFSNGRKIKAHEKPISSLSAVKETPILISSSYDQTIKIWDILSDEEPIVIPFKERVFFTGTTSTGSIVAVGSENTIFEVDLRDPTKILKRFASLDKQIRSFCVSNSEEPFWAIGSIDGRIAIEYAGDEAHQAQRFAFKAASGTEDEEKFISYPIQSLAFHPTKTILVSGSCDGYLKFWDYEEKKRIPPNLQNFSTSITALEYNNEGTSLAIGVSYSWDKGNQEHPNDRLIICNPDLLLQ